MKAKKILMFLMIVFSSAPFIAAAQDAAAPPKVEEKTFTLSGSIDTYAHTTLGYKNAAGGSGPTTSFSNLKGFSLGMFNLIASYQGEKVGFTADAVFGPRGYDAVFNPSYTNQRILNQLFVYYKFSDALTLNLGQFNTFLGYEVISPTLNMNYSTSYLFTNGPFNHTGARLDFASESGFVAKLALMNPTDIVEFNPVNTYTLGAQLGFTNDAGGVWFNALYGDQDGKLNGKIDAPGTSSRGKIFQVDLTTGWTLGESFYLGFNTSLQRRGVDQVVTPTGGVEDVTGTDPSSFFGAAVYPKIIFSESFSLGVRGEYFSVKNSHITPFGLNAEGDGNVIAGTLSANYKINGLTIIPEFRVDKTSELSFTNKDGDAKDLMPSLTLACVYKF